MIIKTGFDEVQATVSVLKGTRKGRGYLLCIFLVIFTVIEAELQATLYGLPPTVRQVGPSWCPRPTGKLRHSEGAVLGNLSLDIAEHWTRQAIKVE